LGFPGFFNWFLALESPTSFQFQVFRETFPRILFLKLHQISETEFSGNSTRAGSKRETSKSVSHVKKCLKHHEVSSFSFTNDKNSLTTAHSTLSRARPAITCVTGTVTTL